MSAVSREHRRERRLLLSSSELCSFPHLCVPAERGWGRLPSSGSGLTSEFPGVIKRLLFESQLIDSGRGKKNCDTERVIWAIRGVKFPLDKRQSCVCAHDLHTNRHPLIAHRLIHRMDRIESRFVKCNYTDMK